MATLMEKVGKEKALFAAKKINSILKKPIIAKKDNDRER